jgi:hypothetical protein
MPGVQRARSLVCEIKKHTSSHHGHTGNIRHSPRNGFNGFLRALPGDRAFLPPSHATMRKHRGLLDISVEISEPHDFAVRFQHASSWRRKRPSQPAPNVRDDREAPLLEERGPAGLVELICPTAQAELSTGSVEPIRRIGTTASNFMSCKAMVKRRKGDAPGCRCKRCGLVLAALHPPCETPQSRAVR